MSCACRRPLREHVLTTVDELADEDGTVALTTVVDLAQQRCATHERFPKGRLRSSVTCTEVDLEARCEVERVPGRSPQRIVRWRPDPEG